MIRLVVDESGHGIYVALKLYQFLSAQVLYRHPVVHGQFLMDRGSRALLDVRGHAPLERVHLVVLYV